MRTHILIVGLSNLDMVEKYLVSDVSLTNDSFKLLGWSSEGTMFIHILILVIRLVCKQVASKEVVELLLVDEVTLEPGLTRVGLLGDKNLHKSSPLNHPGEIVDLLFRLG